MNLINRVNRFLATAIATLNAILAIVIVSFTALGTAIAMSFLDNDPGGKIGLGIAGFLLGIVLGVVSALVICGIIALLVDIRQVLIETRDRVGSAD